MTRTVSGPAFSQLLRSSALPWKCWGQTKPMETHPVATGSIVTNRAMKKGQRIDGEAWVSYGAPISGLFLGPPL